MILFDRYNDLWASVAQPSEYNSQYWTEGYEYIHNKKLINIKVGRNTGFIFPHGVSLYSWLSYVLLGIQGRCGHEPKDHIAPHKYV